MQSLVFSRFPEALKLVALALQTNGIRFASLTGGKVRQNRLATTRHGVTVDGGLTNKSVSFMSQAVRAALQQFIEDADTRVFLLSHRAGAAGLTLTRASHGAVLTNSGKGLALPLSASSKPPKPSTLVL